MWIKYIQVYLDYFTFVLNYQITAGDTRRYASVWKKYPVNDAFYNTKISHRGQSPPLLAPFLSQRLAVFQYVSRNGANHFHREGGSPFKWKPRSGCELGWTKEAETSLHCTRRIVPRLSPGYTRALVKIRHWLSVRNYLHSANIPLANIVVDPFLSFDFSASPFSSRRFSEKRRLAKDVTSQTLLLSIKFIHLNYLIVSEILRTFSQRDW